MVIKNITKIWSSSKKADDFIFNIKGGVSLNFAKGGLEEKGGPPVIKGGLGTLDETMRRKVARSEWT